MDFVVKSEGIILVDFDNTVFTWWHGSKGVKRVAEGDKLSKVMRGLPYYETNGQMNSLLVQALENSKEKFGIYMLSHCSSIFTFEKKKVILEREVPGLFDGYLFVDRPEMKAEVAYELRWMLTNQYHIQNPRVVMIDDLERVCSMFLDRGMEFYYPSEIMLYQKIPNRF